MPPTDDTFSLPPAEERYDAFGVGKVDWTPGDFIHPLSNPEIRSYLDAVYERTRSVEVAGVPRTFEDRKEQLVHLFVLPRLSETPIDPSANEESWRDRLLPVVRVLKENRHCVLLGDPGCGKTTLVDWLTNQLAGTANSIPKEHLGWLIPVRVVLRNLILPSTANADTLLQALLEQQPAPHLTLETAVFLIQRGQLILFLDGIDEMGDLHRRDGLQEAVLLLLHAFRNLRLVATSRTIGYEEAPLCSGPSDYSRWISVARMALRARRLARDVDQARGPSSEVHVENPGAKGDALEQVLGHDLGHKGEIEDILGDPRQAPAEDPAPKLPTFSVAPFTDEQIGDSVTRWYASRESDASVAEERTAEFLRAVRSDRNLLTLARTPRLLTMMTLIHRTYTRLPHGRTELYRDFADCYLETLPVYKGLNTPFTPREKSQVLEDIAFEMHWRTGGPEEGRDDAPRSLVLSWAAGALEKLGDPRAKENAEAILDHIARSSGLLIPVGTFDGEETFAFAHRSFREYFAAGRMLRALHAAGFGDDPDKRLSKEAIAKLAGHAHWNLALQFLFQMVEPNAADWLAKEALRIGTQTPSGGPLKQRVVNLLALVIADPYCRLTPGAMRELIDGIFRVRDYNDAAVSVLLDSPERREIVDAAIDAVGDTVTRLDYRPVGEPDLSRVARLKELKVLSASHSNITDISALSELRKLETLDLEGTTISDLAPLRALCSLRDLYLNNTGVRDLEPLTDLAELEVLQLFHTPVESLNPLRACKKLRRIYAPYTNVTDIEVVRNLPELLDLWIGGSSVGSLAPLVGCRSLTNLSASITPEHDLAPLAELPALTELNLDGGPAKNYDGLFQCKSLIELNLEFLPEPHWPRLKALGRLQALRISRTPPPDLNLLVPLTSLRSLGINASELNSWEPLLQLTSLRRLDLTSPRYPDLDILAGLPSLRSVYLSEEGGVRDIWTRPRQAN